jgi:hypothetical protein
MAGKNNKPSKFAEESAETDAIERNYVRPVEDWDTFDGQEYGGAAPILVLHENEVAGPFAYMGYQKVVTELGEATVHSGSDTEGQSWRLPIQATFIRAIDQANLKIGDRFAVRRDDDVTKKRGKGAGNAMAIFRIKVTERASAPLSV